MDKVTKELIEIIEAIADRCDLWAQQSLDSGWSTHQVEDNRKAADECRRAAAIAKAAFVEA